MTRLNKIFCTAAAICCFAPLNTYAVQPVAKLTVYAGPQSLAPQESIHVTVEAVNANGGLLKNEIVELTYNNGGELKTLLGRTENGLASFEVPAQTNTGLMTFLAKAGGSTSAAALVSVLAGQPHKFSISVNTADEAGNVEIRSNIITDRFDNAVSNLSLVSIEWLDLHGLISQQSVQLLNGRVFLTSPCPSEFSGPLNIRAAFNTAQSISYDISSLCITTKG